LKAYPADVGEDARTGLAGPIWGLGAALFAWGAALLTAQPVWFAIARTGAWINLFNLIPIWQLDGGRGFRALTRRERGYILALALILWALTEESMLLFIALGALYRLFSKDYAEQPDRGVLFQYGGLLVALSLLLSLIVR
jgi:Zn-dependent protease